MSEPLELEPVYRRHASLAIDRTKIDSCVVLRGRFPPTDGTGGRGRIVKAATVRALFLVILLLPPDPFYRMTAIRKELDEDIVTGTIG